MADYPSCLRKACNVSSRHVRLPYPLAVPKHGWPRRFSTAPVNRFSTVRLRHDQLRVCARFHHGSRVNYIACAVSISSTWSRSTVLRCSLLPSTRSVFNPRTPPSTLSLITGTRTLAPLALPHKQLQNVCSFSAGVSGTAEKGLEGLVYIAAAGPGTSFLVMCLVRPRDLT
jgi:hypothetical protein